MKRFGSILAIWVGCAFAWMVLGSTLTVRSGEMSSSLLSEVHRLWGPEGVQRAPTAAFTRTGYTEEIQTTTVDGETRQTSTQRVTEERVEVPLVQSHLRAQLELEQRQKGLNWFPTYDITFRGLYRFVNPSEDRQSLQVVIPLMADNVGYDNFTVRRAGGAEIPFDITPDAALVVQELAGGEDLAIEVSYRTRGTSSWTYHMAQGNGRVRDFVLEVDTDFAQVDFPPGSLSPSEHQRSGSGWHGEWRFDSLISSAPVALQLPEELNPGPLASRITFFAPVSLLFFFFVLAVLATVQRKALHPMHYFMIGCAFFAFHLLFAYLVDHVPVTASFALSALVSVLLVVSYARLFVGWRFALREIGVSQVLYLVLFSYSFFWDGFTGLAITLGAIATLFVMMQVTGRLDWAELTGAKPEGDAQPPSWADPTGNAAHGDLPASAAVSGAKPVSF
ncbi:MAG: inner membrane CreD family protein [Sandaracinaceae bacterium]|nr:inner membrane CreD family protein [Sandaracinaceae bacterium]